MTGPRSPSSARLHRRAVLAAAMAAPFAAGSAQAGIFGRRSSLIYIGSHASQILAARLDLSSGALTPLGVVAEGPRATWALRQPRSKLIHFTDEVGNDGSAPGGVVTYRADPATGALTRLGDVRAGGGGTTNLWFDAPSRTMLAANFGGGSLATLAVSEAGLPQTATTSVALAGSGPHRRQNGPHPHAVRIDPTGRFALAPDMGADRVFVLPWDAAAGRLGALDPARPGHYVAPAGSGPRHIAFDRTGRRLYLIQELTAEIVLLTWDAGAGALTAVQTWPLNVEGFTGAPSGAELALGPDGRFLYAANRGANELVVFAVDRATGGLSVVQRIPAGGERPWHFALHPGGRWLLAANRDSNALRVFAIDRRTGRLTDTGQGMEAPQPVHIHVFG